MPVRMRFRRTPGEFGGAWVTGPLPAVEPLERRLCLSAAVLRVDPGGGPTTDSLGQTWAADTGFAGGGANAKLFAVAGTTDDALYATRRTGDFTYTNAVPDGDYTLRLLFTDTNTSPGLRQFDVNVENQQI